MKVTRKNLSVLICYLLYSFASYAQDGRWHPEITLRPRAIFRPTERQQVKDNIQNDGIYATMYRSMYSSSLNSSSDQTAQAKIAKVAAFVVAMDIEPSGNAFSKLNPQTRATLASKVTTYLQSLNPTVKSPSTNYQWRASELIHFAQAYDLLQGSGFTRDTVAEKKLAQFASNAYDELGLFLTVRNNLSIKLASALGMTAVVLNDYPSTDASMQPKNWIARAMTFIDDSFWKTMSTAGTVSGYSEGPYYFRYAMMSAAPFFYAMKNFNGDWTENYQGTSLRSPWFDTRYHNLYDWIAKLQMPDGRIPFFEDTYIDSYFPELGIFSSIPNQSAPYAWQMYSKGIPLTPADLNSEMSGTYDFRAEYIAAKVQPTSVKPANLNPTQFIPDAGYFAFRNSWQSNASYLAAIGKHGRARTGESPLGSGHKQANETSFILHAGGEDLLIEPAYHSYDLRDSLIWSKNHNLVLVDGKGPDGVSFGTNLWGVDAYIEDTLSSRRNQIARIRTQYQDASINRSFYFLDNSFYMIVDRVSSTRQRTFTHQLHGKGLLANSTYNFNPQTHTARWNVGKMTIDATVRGISNSDSTLQYTTVTRKHSPGWHQFAEHSALYSSLAGNDAVFAALLVPYNAAQGSSPAVISSSNSTSINHTIKSGNKQIMALTNKKGETTELKGPTKTIATDGTFGFYSTDTTQRYNFDILADGASHFTVDGRQILWSSAKVSGVLEYTRTSIRGTVRGNDLSHIELATEYQPATVAGKNVTRWFMNTHRIVLESSAKEADFDIELSDMPTDVEAAETAATPEKAFLGQNYPNPANPETHVLFNLPKRDFISLDVFNTLGEKLFTAMEGEMPAGDHIATINLEGLASGRYYYRLRTSSETLTRSMIVMK